MTHLVLPITLKTRTGHQVSGVVLVVTAHRKTPFCLGNARRETDEVLESFKKVMIELSSHTNQEEIKPLQTRMKTSWTDASKEEKKMYTENAT